MDNLTLNPAPAYGTVDHYAAGIRESIARHPDGLLRETIIMAEVLGAIQSIVRFDRDDPDGKRVEMIRNILAAEQLVRAELEAGR